MYRYKLIAMKLVGIKSPLEKSVERKLHSLENEGMIDLMVHQFNRYKKVTHFTLAMPIWQSWIRRQFVMEGRTYADYLLNSKSLVNHPAIMPATAHAPVGRGPYMGGAWATPIKNYKKIEKLVAQSRARNASMNTGIRPGVLREIAEDELIANA